MSDVKPGMERVTITLPPALLERIDRDRARAGGKRSTFIVKVLEAYYRKGEHDEKGDVRAVLIELVREQPELFRGVGAGVDLVGREEGAEASQVPEAVPVRVRKDMTHRRPRGDSILITEDMKELMMAYLDNPERPVRAELRRDYQVDTSDLPRWISGEKPRMKRETWIRLKPVLERFSGE
ncbi:MAG: hypothetical protein GX465_14410 [Acidobacteria bacterium]|jgi:hypothetical protein|nr:hypothetical protein [Acidobacteriota bacterium]